MSAEPENPYLAPQSFPEQRVRQEDMQPPPKRPRVWTVVKYGAIPEPVEWGVHIAALVVGAACFGLSLWVLFGRRSK